MGADAAHAFTASRTHGRARRRRPARIIGLTASSPSVKQALSAARAGRPLLDWWICASRKRSADHQTRLQTLCEQLTRPCPLPPALTWPKSHVPGQSSCRCFQFASGFMAATCWPTTDGPGAPPILAPSHAFVDRSTLGTLAQRRCACAAQAFSSPGPALRYSAPRATTFPRRTRGARALESFGEAPTDVPKAHAARASRRDPTAGHRAMARQGKTDTPSAAQHESHGTNDAERRRRRIDEDSQLDESHSHQHTGPRFTPLEQGGLPAPEHRSLPKGLLHLFKGRTFGSWPTTCAALRDDLIVLAQRRVCLSTRAYPFSAARCQTGPATTAQDTTFLPAQS